MSDVSEVTQTLVGLIAGFLYPNGASSPSAIGVSCRVFAGWPLPSQLQEDMKEGLCDISVYPWPGERNTTRYLLRETVTQIQPKTLAIEGIGLTATLSGTIPPASNPHVVMIFANEQPYAYAVLPTDTIQSICAALAALIVVDVLGTFSTTNSVVLPFGARLGACEVGTTATVMTEITRQEKQFHVIIWAPKPQMRAAVGRFIDPALKVLTFITLPDGSGGRIRYVGNTETDVVSKEGAYRRDLIYTVEYPTMRTIVAPQVLAIHATYETDVGTIIDEVWVPDTPAPIPKLIQVLTNDAGTEILTTDDGQSVLSP